MALSSPAEMMGGFAALDHIGKKVHAAAGKFLGNGFHFTAVPERLNKQCFGAGFCVKVSASDGILKAVNGPRIGTGHDERVFINAGIACRADFLSMLFGGNDLLAFHMPAALRPHLIFKEDAGGTRGLVFTEFPAGSPGLEPREECGLSKFF